MDIDKESNQMYVYILEKKFVLLPPLKLYVCSPTWVYRKLYGRATFVFCHAREYKENLCVHHWNLKVANETG